MFVFGANILISSNLIFRHLFQLQGGKNARLIAGFKGQFPSSMWYDGMEEGLFTAGESRVTPTIWKLLEELANGYCYARFPKAASSHVYHFVESNTPTSLRMIYLQYVCFFCGSSEGNSCIDLQRPDS